MSQTESPDETLVTALKGTITIKEVAESFTESGHGWKIVDAESGNEFRFHVDDIPELISALEAVHEKLSERDHVDAKSTLDNGSIRISREK